MLLMSEVPLYARNPRGSWEPTVGLSKGRYGGHMEGGAGACFQDASVGSLRLMQSHHS